MNPTGKDEKKPLKSSRKTDVFHNKEEDIEAWGGRNDMESSHV